MGDSAGEITVWLSKLRTGDRAAEAKLMPLVYDELRRQARRYMRGERQDHTLQPTALVHEAYIRLVGQREIEWQNRAHFFGMAANLMRQILVDHARKRNAGKRFGGQQKMPFEDADFPIEGKAMELLAIDEALSRLSKLDPRQARVVELRFFAGLSEKEIGEVEDIGVRTVKRDWSMARAWLYREINGKNPSRRPKAAKAVSGSGLRLFL